METLIEKLNTIEFKTFITSLNNKSISSLYTIISQSSLLVIMKNEEELCCVQSTEQLEIDNKLDEGWNIESFLLFRKPTTIVKKNINDMIEFNIDEETNKDKTIKVLLCDEDFGKLYAVIEEVFLDRELDIDIESFEENELSEDLDEYHSNRLNKMYNDESLDAYEMQGVYIEDVLEEDEFNDDEELESN